MHTRVIYTGELVSLIKPTTEVTTWVSVNVQPLKLEGLIKNMKPGINTITNAIPCSPLVKLSI